MTEYTILVIADSVNPPVTYQEAGTVKADSKEKAVRRFKQSKSIEEMNQEFDFAGHGKIVDVLAVPNSYVNQYALNYCSGNADVTEVT
jgi:hypothetical protein